MRMSHQFSQTLREAPGDAEVVSHQLLVRAGYIRPIAAGIFSYLPFGRRSMDKIKAIIREEMNAINGQEMTMPVVNPATVWQETNRWYDIGSELGRFQDKNGRDMVLALSHEEIVTDLVRREIQSHRQLPQMIYHMQTKWRDDPRPRAGLIRAREFTMLDSYTIDADEAGLAAQYWTHYQSYFNIFRRCGLETLAVEADTGMMGGKFAHEFMYVTPIGEDTLILCDGCGYRANRQIAVFSKSQAVGEQPLPLEKVATPETRTIDDLAAFLGVPHARTAKAVFMIGTFVAAQEKSERFIFAVVRGDMDVNETKLLNAVDAKALRTATEEEIRAVGAVPGYASPVGLSDVLVVVDDAIPTSPNLVAGANEDGFHLLNVNYGRDFSADIVADIVAAAEGDVCTTCGTALHTVRAVETGNIFWIGTHYSDLMGATFSRGKESTQTPVQMGSYGIGIGRLLACIAEEYNDDDGLTWPITVAPFQVHLVQMRGTETEAEQIYADLLSAGIDVLFDDRDESPGVKFNDADLIGVPLRITVGKRALQQGGVELKRRTEKEHRIVPLTNVVNVVQKEIETLLAAINATVQPVSLPVSSHEDN
ncbi:MAG: proline--tRNA ligase [Anaerolineae bacterium]|nr:proline--tRNA ligase [Anaerolineae bacterium]